MENIELIEATKFRVKLKQLSILMEKAKESIGREKDMFIERCLEILAKMRIDQEKRIDDMVDRVGEKDEKLRIKLKKKASPQKSIDIFAENPFQKQANMFEENPFKKGSPRDQATESSSSDELPTETETSSKAAPNQKESIAPEILEQLKNKESSSNLLLESLQKSKKLLNLIDMEETESELSISKDAPTCLIHRGPIKGIAYICPKCMATYCAKCARTLKEQGENCWSCEEEIHT